jgi:hypothetical protein
MPAAGSSRYYHGQQQTGLFGGLFGGGNKANKVATEAAGRREETLPATNPKVPRRSRQTCHTSSCSGSRGR